MVTRNTEALNFKVTPELKAAVERYSVDHGMTIATAVRLILDAGLEALVAKPVREDRLATPKAPQPDPPTGRVPFSEGRPYVVAASLDDLTGPTSGVITLPRHIDWSGSPQRDLDAHGELFTLYPTVLAEAASVADLNAWLDKATLIRFWPNLFLPAKVRRLWEERFPELAATRTPKP